MTEFNPFITIGDAITSFLRIPDDSTCKYGALSSDEVQRTRFLKLRGVATTLPKPWASEPRRWLDGKTGSRWDIGIIL